MGRRWDGRAVEQTCTSEASNTGVKRRKQLWSVYINHTLEGYSSGKSIDSLNTPPVCSNGQMCIVRESEQRCYLPIRYFPGPEYHIPISSCLLKNRHFSSVAHRSPMADISFISIHMACVPKCSRTFQMSVQTSRGLAMTSNSYRRVISSPLPSLVLQTSQRNRASHVRICTTFNK